MTFEEIARKARIMTRIRSIIMGLERLEKLLEDDYPVGSMQARVFSGRLEELSKKIGWEGRGNMKKSNACDSLRSGQLDKLIDKIKDCPVEHGVTCCKLDHAGTGYLHDKNDDSPYDVDGCMYCGRCHYAL